MSERITRKYPQHIREVLADFVKENGLGQTLNAYRVCEAWKQVSGMERYTSSCHFRDGTLTVTFSSSTARGRLDPLKNDYIRAINEWLLKDELFDPGAEGQFFLKNIIMR